MANALDPLSQATEDLSIEKISSGDRPSLYALGLAAAEALKQARTAVLMVDVLGRVRLMPQEAVKVLHPPKIEDEDLDLLSEEEAIDLLVVQGDSEQMILEYVTRRKTKN
jgi:hypothetical protein